MTDLLTLVQDHLDAPEPRSAAEPATRFEIISREELFRMALVFGPDRVAFLNDPTLEAASFRTIDGETCWFRADAVDAAVRWRAAPWRGLP